MGRYARAFGPEHPEATYVGHEFREELFDTGEVEINYAVAGDRSKPALLLIPGQTESWWGYEGALGLLAEHFEAFAVDLRGQGRSSRTPGRYTLDNMGNDLVRFIGGVIGRPTIVSGLSSGGVLSAWLSAYGLPGVIRGAHYEDPPVFLSELDTTCGQSVRQGIGPMLGLWSKYLGDQWSIGDWEGMVAAAAGELPAWLAGLFALMASDEPNQNMKEYDPEWARAFATGTVGAGCDHGRMLAQVKVPVLFTHHFRAVDEASGSLMGASSDLQAGRARELIEGAGQRCDYRSFPAMGHSMHGQDPALFTATLAEWADALPPVT
jgi:pimeloyl-ACP methyl ester carboxylesterase